MLLVTTFTLKNPSFQIIIDDQYLLNLIEEAGDVFIELRHTQTNLGNVMTMSKESKL